MEMGYIKDPEEVYNVLEELMKHVLTEIKRM